MQAIRKRDKHIAAQLDEEEALVKTLPAAAGILRQSQLDKIDKQRATLQLEEPSEKKAEAPPAATTIKRDVLNNTNTGAASAASNKPAAPINTEQNPANPTSKEEYDKLPPNSYYMQDGGLKRKKG